MSNIHIRRRIEFTIVLLNNLKEIYAKLREISSNIENDSDKFYENFFNSSKYQVQEDIDNYLSNVEKIKDYNLLITEKINEWYDFIKDSNEIKKVFFPIKLHFKKKYIKNYISKAKQSISELSIENRFIREKIINWEQELSVKSLQQIREDNKYKTYEQLIMQKDHIVSELKYIIATLPDINVVKINADSIDTLIENFQL
ncbi:UNVERIFIED_CONTAM: hypothetical protein Cloal_3965 [Acetivibrio alkalicellulosi]